MDDAFAMSGVESIRELYADIQETINGQRVAAKFLIEAMPFEKFHRDERFAIDFVDFVDGADVRVIQGGGSASLPRKAFQICGIGFDRFGKKLQSDAAT
jgi:hypothetical protein